MALLLKPETSYIADTGAIISTAYLKITPIGVNDKDKQIQQFTVCIFNSKTDKKKRPVISVQITVTGNDYNIFFSPPVLESKSIYVNAYDYVLERAKLYQEEQSNMALLTDEELMLFQPKYKDFNWLQGDIWVSDEV